MQAESGPRGPSHNIISLTYYYNREENLKYEVEQMRMSHKNRIFKCWLPKRDWIAKWVKNLHGALFGKIDWNVIGLWSGFVRHHKTKAMKSTSNSKWNLNLEYTYIYKYNIKNGKQRHNRKINRSFLFMSIQAWNPRFWCRKSLKYLHFFQLYIYLYRGLYYLTIQYTNMYEIPYTQNRL